MSNILTPGQINAAMNADPTDILRAIHKRIVDTEKLMGEYRNFAMNQQVAIEMLEEKVASLKGKVERLCKNDLLHVDNDSYSQLRLFGEGV